MKEAGYFDWMTNGPQGPYPASPVPASTPPGVLILREADMARVNTKAKTAELEVANATAFTHGGSVAAEVSPFAQLRRSVLSCMLFEKEFYESGKAIAERIEELARQVDPRLVARLAVEAREEHGLRSVPLLLCVVLSRTGAGIPNLVSDTVARVVSRADEMGELLALYWRGKRRPVAAQLKKGLARAFAKFDGYQLAKHDRGDAAVRPRDVMFLVHPKPSGEARADLQKAVAGRALPVPDTWETELSAGKDRKATFERLLAEGRLGYTALLRNLRLMQEAGVDEETVRAAIRARKGARGVLPFQFVSAAEAAPRFAADLEAALTSQLEGLPKLPGKTVIVVDVSGSMSARLSARSARDRLDASAILAGCLVAVCERPVVYATAGSDSRRVHDTREVRAATGLGMVDVMRNALRTQGMGGIFLTQAMKHVAERETDVERVIVLTDEQDTQGTHDPLKSPSRAPLVGRRAYLVNVASAKNGIGYGRWIHLDGFSEAILKWIPAFEAEDDGMECAA